MDRLRTALENLIADLPIKRYIKLRVVPMAAHGSCSLSDSERFITISINAKDTQDVQEDTLIHEYAHAMEFDQTGNHSKLWGQCHSKAYTSWTKRNV